MRIVGLAMLERARAPRDSIVNFARTDNRPDRLASGAQSLPERHDVGDDAILLAPPYNVTDAELDMIVDLLGDTSDAILPA